MPKQRPDYNKPLSEWTYAQLRARRDEIIQDTKPCELCNEPAAKCWCDDTWSTAYEYQELSKEMIKRNLERREEEAKRRGQRPRQGLLPEAKAERLGISDEWIVTYGQSRMCVYRGHEDKARLIAAELNKETARAYELGLSQSDEIINDLRDERDDARDTAKAMANATTERIDSLTTFLDSLRPDQLADLIIQLSDQRDIAPTDQEITDLELWISRLWDQLTVLTGTAAAIHELMEAAKPKEENK